jgi:hypothetical protein
MNSFRFVLLAAAIAALGCAGELEDSAPETAAAALGQAEGALDPGAGARVKGPNRCMTDSDCATFACDCACKATSVTWQKTDCKTLCTDDPAPCTGLEAVCEKHKCVLTEADPLPPGACTVEQPCAQPFEMCWDDDDPFCGICMDPEMIGTCEIDDDCMIPGAGGAQMVCDATPSTSLCLCFSAPICVPACADSSACGEGEVCQVGHCVAQPCGPGTAPCPPDFACTPASECTRKSCTSSSQCDGHCVKGQCWADPGFCSPPPP